MTCNIKCQFHNKTSRGFYVDEKLKVWPCCYYSGESLLDRLEESDNRMYQHTKENPTWNDLAVNSMTSIIASDMYQDHIYYPGWETNPSDICIDNCSDLSERKRIKVTIKRD